MLCLFWWWKVVILALILWKYCTIGTINLEMFRHISLHSTTLAYNVFVDISKGESPPNSLKVYAVPIVQYHITHCLEKLCYWLVFSQIITREIMHKKLRLRKKKLVLKIHKNLQIDIGEQWDKKGRKTALQYSCSTCDYFLYNNWKNCYNYIYICKYLTWEVPSRFK